MQYSWLNKQNNKNLVVFFAGWSFDEKPFEFLSSEDSDVLFVYDYNNIEELDSNLFANYSHKTLITWSMGVFVAYLFREKFKDFDKKIAINGTIYPVHNEFGIPEKPFILTLRHAKTGLEGKFYQNVFQENSEFERYLTTPVQRSIDNRVDELKNLYETIKTTEINSENFYTNAIISLYDKIIPTKNQKEFWQGKVNAKTIESGHFLFYNFTSWNEIINYAN